MPDSGRGTVTLNYGMLRSPVSTRLPDAPVQELHFNLTGNMNRYVWSINNKVVSEADRDPDPAVGPMCGSSCTTGR